jgi:uncharacterized Ntn-hydrolase superfamily protein
VTYSIVAVDTQTHQVGGAGTSCVGMLSVRIIYGSVPGKGAVHAQALLGGPGKNAAVMQVGMDVAPADIITAITAPAFDGNAQRRQYGIVDLQARSAGFTGAQNGAVADDQHAQVGPYTFSVQGNILTSNAVLDQATMSFQTVGCDLADRLMLSLEAGARNGQGDSRCTPQGIPSDSAFIQVDRAGEAAGSYLQLEVVSTSPNNPLLMLRAQYDAWRATNPCPVPSSDAGIGGDAGTNMDEMGAGCCSAGADSSSLVIALAVAMIVARRTR